MNATEDGHRALMELAAGDMRRVLNLLQSTHMAYPIVNEENVYLTAGAALPGVIQSILNSLLNDSFENAHRLLSSVSSSYMRLSIHPAFINSKFYFKSIQEFGYALCDIVTELSLLVAKKNLPDRAMAYILDKLSNIEFRLSHGVSEKIQIGALVGVFVVVREMLVVTK